MKEEHAALLEVLDNHVKVNLDKLIRIPKRKSFLDDAQRQRWNRLCHRYKNSRLVRYGKPLDFTQVFLTWRTIDLMPESLMNQDRKTFIYMELFESVYSEQF